MPAIQQRSKPKVRITYFECPACYRIWYRKEFVSGDTGLADLKVLVSLYDHCFDKKYKTPPEAF